jgi:hypothetical protein
VKHAGYDRHNFIFSLLNACLPINEGEEHENETVSNRAVIALFALLVFLIALLAYAQPALGNQTTNSAVI